ncbi:MAG: flippase [Chloroflexi bacterium]|nr:flippase [Chloroflexota bacterium]
MSIRSTRIVRNFSWLSIAQLASRFLAFITTIYLTRTLGVEGFGVIVFATAALPYASLIIDFGFQSLGPIKVARDPLAAPNFVKMIIGIRLGLSVIAIIILLLFIQVAAISNLTKIVTLLYGISLLAHTFDINWVFLGSEAMRPAAIAEVFSQVVMLVGVLFYVNNPDDVINVPIIFFVSRFTSVVFLLVRFKQSYGGIWPKVPLEDFRRIFLEVIPFAASGVVGTILQSTDIVLIGFWLGLEGTGLYGAARRITWLPILLATAYFQALRPILARAFIDGIKTVENLLERSMRLISASSVGMVIGGIIVAESLTNFLFGSEFAAAVFPLRVLLISIGLFLIARHYRLLLITFNLQKIDLKIMVIVTTANLTLNVLLINRYGLLGSAIAASVSETIYLAFGYYYTRKFVGYVPFLRYLGKPLIAASVMALGLYLSQPLHVVVRIALGGGIYLTILFLLKTINRKDIRQIKEALFPEKMTQ